MNRILTLMLACALAPVALAQDAGGNPLARLQQLQAAVAPGKQIFIARQLQLTPEEAADFWPAYDAHQAGLADLERKRGELLARREQRQAENDWDPGDTEDLAEEMLALEADEADLLEGTFARLTRAGLTMEKAVRYIELEKDLRALRHFQRPAPPYALN